MESGVVRSLAVLAFDYVEAETVAQADRANEQATEICDQGDLFDRWLKLVERIEQGLISEQGQAIEFLKLEAG